MPSPRSIKTGTSQVGAPHKAQKAKVPEYAHSDFKQILNFEKLKKIKGATCSLEKRFYRIEITQKYQFAEKTFRKNCFS